jgi:hypothetical protein
MSKSTRYYPAAGRLPGRSEKHDKRFAHRRFRRHEREAIHHGREPPVSLRQISDIWNFNKDGKRWFGYHPEEEWWQRLMRK